MARILYGVSGEGSGHSSRARVVTRLLQERGHQVRIATYDRGLANLGDDFDVVPISGLTIGVRDGRVSYRRSLLENAARIPDGIRGLQRLRRSWKEFRPEIVLTDFEPTCAYLALQRGLPLVSVDNQHRMRYMSLPVPEELRGAARQTRAIIRAMVPRPDVCVATTFFMGEVTDPRLICVPPILRQQVRELEPREGGAVLVYVTKAFGSLLDELRRHPQQPFVVYGLDQTAGMPDHITCKAPSQAGFLADLAAARAVVATAGFTLLTECLHLGKPLLALPLEGQFEQELNAILLEASGCGMDGRVLGPAGLGDFLAQLDRFRGPLDRYDSGSPGALGDALDEALARVRGAGAGRARGGL